MTLVRPIGYDISIRKQGDMFLLEYTEFFDRNDKDAVTAVENTIEHLDTIKNNAPKNTALPSLTVDKTNYSIHMEMIGSFEDIADHITSEFMSFGRAGKMTIKDIFEYVARNVAGVK